MQQSVVKFIALSSQTLLNMFRALQCPSSGARQNCRCSLWFPYECGGGSVLRRGQFVIENTSTSTFIRKPEAATAV